MIKELLIYCIIFVASAMLTYTALTNYVDLNIQYTEEKIETSVTLIPDADGTVGVISVSNETGIQVVDKPFTQVSVKNTEEEMVAQKRNKEEVLKEFESALQAKPNVVTNYILYFMAGKDELTEESNFVLKKVFEDIKGRNVFEMSIVGHTDTTGDSDKNFGLGLNRAKRLEAIIIQSFGDKHKILVDSHGEGDLLVETKDNVNEPRNRRVEVQIK